MNNTFIHNSYTNKIVRTALKIVIVFTVLILMMLTAASVYVHYNKEKIIAKIKEQVYNNVRGEVHIKNIDIAVWSSFPYIAAQLNNVSLLDSHYHTPLLNAAEISCKINLFQLLGRVYDIAKIKIANGSFHLFTDSLGYSNAYLLGKKDTASSVSSSSSAITIHNINLENVSALIEDVPKQKRYELRFSSLKANIDKEDSILEIELNENCFVKGLGFYLAKGIYLQNHTVNTANCNLKFNTATKELTFDKTSFDINHHIYFVQGKFHFRDSSFFQLHIQTKDIQYKQAMKVLTERIQNKLAMVDLKEPFNVEADLEGPLASRSDPYITVHLQTTANEIITPVVTLSKCNFKGKYTNHINDSLPQSDENSIILFSNFTGDWNGIKLSTDSILISNVDEPVIRFTFLSQCSLKELGDNLALNTLQLLDGTAQLILQYNGPLIADAAILTKLHAKMLLQNGIILYEPRNIQFNNCNGDVAFDENELTISKLQCDVKENHFEVRAAGRNMSRLAGTDSGRAFVVFDVASPSVNLNDFTLVLLNKKPTTNRSHKKSGLAYTASVVDEMLEKGTLQMNVHAGHVAYNHFTADNVAAAFLFGKDSWEIQQASLQHAGGRLSLTAKISETGSNYNLAKATIALNNVDVKKVFYAFDNFGLDDLTHNNIRGIMSTTANLNLSMSNTGHIILNSMQGAIDFSIRNGALINYKPLESLNDIIFKNRDFSHIEFAELTDRLSLNNGLAQINKMEIASSVLHIFVEGLYDFNKTNTDISIQIPLSNLKKQNGNRRQQNKGVDTKAGASIYLRAKSGKNGEIKISFDPFKKLRKTTASNQPDVKPNRK